LPQLLDYKNDGTFFFYQFGKLPADNAVNTKLFLESVAYLPPFFGDLYIWMVIFSFQKIRGVFDMDPAKYATLQQIVEAEKETHVKLIVLSHRGLCFFQILLQSLADGEKDENNPNLIRVNITKAYDQALKKYHGWLMQKIFKAALLAAPYKSDFIKALSKGQEVTEEDCMASVRQFLLNFTATVHAIYEMYTTLNAELDYSV
uniref:Glycolipid transfer protein n=1 Tax=Hucho hucho TaxID=62062 RepID=A0A4W5N2U7_9TELE